MIGVRQYIAMVDFMTKLLSDSWQMAADATEFAGNISFLLILQ